MICSFVMSMYILVENDEISDDIPCICSNSVESKYSGKRFARRRFRYVGSSGNYYK